MMTREQMWEKAEEIEKMLEENHVWASVHPHYELPVIQVEINWGDWKHEHMRTDWLIAEKCEWLSKIGEQVTEEDGSDTYSAVHNYIIIG